MQQFNGLTVIWNMWKQAKTCDNTGLVIHHQNRTRLMEMWDRKDVVTHNIKPITHTHTHNLRRRWFELSRYGSVFFDSHRSKIFSHIRQRVIRNSIAPFSCFALRLLLLLLFPPQLWRKLSRNVTRSWDGKLQECLTQKILYGLSFPRDAHGEKSVGGFNL